ncbi:hypothetical protein [Sandarakinorhabdus sp. DWP1-3-1]|uniref:hypothetical protein n=1 Tax=Sandarakinorhabdus sp. DWP1-3-1 TaxID=2804627 RepID=UPI003CFB4E6F
MNNGLAPTAAPVGPTFDAARGRAANGLGATGCAGIACIAFWIAGRGFSDAMTAGPLFSPMFDLAVPLVFGAMGILAAWMSLVAVYALVFAAVPCLTLTDAGLAMPLAVTRLVAWRDIACARHVQVERRSRVVIELVPGSIYHRRFWPFWRARTIDLAVRDPASATAAISAHPCYRGTVQALDALDPYVNVN